MKGHELKIYGIKTCSTVSKAKKFLKDNGFEFEFVDYRATPVGADKIKEWLNKTDIDTLFNNKGQKYRDLSLKQLNLDDKGKEEWLAKENMLLKRPILEYGNGEIVIGFKEEIYKEKLL